MAAALAVVSALTLSGCSSSVSGSTASTQPGELQGTLTIFAAASLTESFTELAAIFGSDHPDVTIAPISFDGSTTLATQIREGAPADIFAAADGATMRSVSDLLDGEAIPFASNSLQIAVQPGNPLNISELADLSAPGVQLVLCAPQVPCGATAQTLLDREKIVVTPASEELNVKAVLTKVQLGEADAGLVYVTDIAAAEAVEGINIPEADEAKSTYPLGILESSANPIVAEAFRDFVVSDRGQSVLSRYGFGRS
ncbi:molybdate ABC transporter substrate-binding protein [Salinibacterium sp. M195]|uniref:molybdate ABC transporter substrate-binding protein n=1 Tax=Salinibacterium sp. M195 TaxID=2583374 RepID=UPI002104D03E|nr:molybdate ABC transporter substrate-binding protein [Salinibacterium sp. M195]